MLDTSGTGFGTSLAGVTGFGIGFAVMATVVGGFFLALGVLLLRTQRERARRGVVTEGTIVDFTWGAVRAEPADPGVHAFPVVEFTDLSGRTRTFVHQAGTNLAPRKGRTVPVWYDPLRPDEEPVIHREAVATLGPWLLMGVGALMLTVTGLVVVMVLGA